MYKQSFTRLRNLAKNLITMWKKHFDYSDKTTVDFHCGFIHEIPKKPIKLFSSIKQLINSSEKKLYHLFDWIDQPV